jgi:hypothetical protein
MDRPERAARLFGAAAAHRISMGIPLSTPELAAVKATTDALTNSLGEGAYTSAYEDGETMTLDRAMEYALEELGA